MLTLAMLALADRTGDDQRRRAMKWNCVDLDFWWARVLMIIRILP